MLRKLESESKDLLEGEASAYAALNEAVRVATKELAAELGRDWVSNIAPPRSLCEMIRRRVASKASLCMCHGSSPEQY